VFTRTIGNARLYGTFSSAGDWRWPSGVSSTEGFAAPFPRPILRASVKRGPEGDGLVAADAFEGCEIFDGGRGMRWREPYSGPIVLPISGRLDAYSTGALGGLATIGGERDRGHSTSRSRVGRSLGGGP